MNPARESLIQQKYPELFPADTDPRQLPFELSVGDGWATLLEVLFEQLCRKLRGAQARQTWLSDLAQQDPTRDRAELDQATARLETARKDLPVLVQVKEKMGELSVYMNGGDEAACAWVEMACAMSARVCETCGESALSFTYRRDWHQTLCPKHADGAYGREIAEAARSRSAYYQQQIALDTQQTLDRQTPPAEKGSDEPLTRL